MSERIEQFKAILQQEKDRLEEELSTIAHQKGTTDGAESWEAVGTMTDDTIDADPNEVADKIEEFETNQAIAANLKVKLNEVNEALGRIEEGSFGICEIGGEEIEEDRLKANPSARTCKAHMN
jgi:RNA polymerase-binding transcription factor DksA